MAPVLEGQKDAAAFGRFWIWAGANAVRIYPVFAGERNPSEPTRRLVRPAD